MQCLSFTIKCNTVYLTIRQQIKSTVVFWWDRMYVEIKSMSNSIKLWSHHDKICSSCLRKERIHLEEMKKSVQIFLKTKTKYIWLIPKELQIYWWSCDRLSVTNTIIRFWATNDQIYELSWQCYKICTAVFHSSLDRCIKYTCKVIGGS